jgi:hypothetical protein
MTTPAPVPPTEARAARARGVRSQPTSASMQGPRDDPARRQRVATVAPRPVAPTDIVGKGAASTAISSIFVA